MTTQTPSTVSWEVYQRERELRIQAEQERDLWKNEFYLMRKLRRAPVLKPATKEVIEEFRHVEKWGQVKGPNGTKRANYKTIAQNLHMDAGTVARHAERAQKLGLVDILEYKGSKDESERKYVHVKEGKLATIDRLTDPDKVIPKQGGDRFTHRCMKCDTEMEIRTVTTKRTKVMLRCPGCHHESLLEEDLEDVIEDTGWEQQNGHKAQKQHAFSETSEPDESQKQNAHHSVYTLTDSEADVAPPVDDTSQKQVAFNANASYAHTYDLLTNPPAFLRRKAIWCCWRWGRDEQGNPTKVPFMADNLGKRKASVSDANTWRSHAWALAVYEQSQLKQGTFTARERHGDVEYSYRFDGIGFMCDGTFTFLDQDHCRNPETGEIDAMAMERARSINSYTEPSVSGHGLHTYAEGTIEGPGRKHNGVEMYSTVRFCVYTGRPLPDFPQEVEPRQDELRALHREYFPPKTEYLWNIEPDDTDEGKSDDEMEQLLHEVKAKMFRSKESEKLKKLWAGDASDYPKENGQPDHSRADAALCNKLAFYAGKKCVFTVDWLFRKSGLMRSKWERADYRELTFRYAFGGGV